jgi:hypothetical protein
MSQKPFSRGLRVCEKVIIEEGTHNYSLINCLRHLVVRQIPSEPCEFVIHAMLGGGAGEMRLEVVIRHPDDDEVVFRREASIQLQDQLQDYRMTIRVRDLIFYTGGRYPIELFIDGDLVDQTSLTIRSRED